MTIEVQLFTDGACSGNPGPGGWAFVLRHLATQQERVDSGGERETTNNRMEMLAVIRGLESLTRPVKLEIVSDSQYVLRGLSEWMPTWKRNGWKKKKGGISPDNAVKNEDLWRRLDGLIAPHTVKYTYIRGHTGHAENERCDQLACDAIAKVMGQR